MRAAPKPKKPPRPNWAEAAVAISTHTAAATSTTCRRLMRNLCIGESVLRYRRAARSASKVRLKPDPTDAPCRKQVASQDQAVSGQHHRWGPPSGGPSEDDHRYEYSNRAAVSGCRRGPFSYRDRTGAVASARCGRPLESLYHARDRRHEPAARVAGTRADPPTRWQRG